MNNRATCFLLVLALGLSLLPTNPAAHVSATLEPQSPGLELSQTRTDLPNGGRMLTLAGQNHLTLQTIKLRAAVIASSVELAGHAPPSSNPEPIESGWQPEENYYAYSEMTRSDGTILMQATFEHDQSGNRSMMYVTLGVVPLTFDLNTQEAGPITEAQENQINAWLSSQDGSFVSSMNGEDDPKSWIPTTILG